MSAQERGSASMNQNKKNNMASQSAKHPQAMDNSHQHDAKNAGHKGGHMADQNKQQMNQMGKKAGSH